MKSTKTKPIQDTMTVPVPVTPAQIAALCMLADALKDSDAERVASRVFSLGLFMLGLNRAGDAGLSEITDSLFGKGSEDAAEAFNSIVNAGDGTRDARENAERDRRRQAFAKAATAQVSA